MAKTFAKLNPKTVAAALPPGHYSDGGNLYLVVKKTGGRSWAFIYRWRGREIEKGFGSARDVTLARARERAAAARARLADGVDPFLVEEVAQIPTFGVLADEVVASLTAGFTSAKHVAQWKMTLSKYAKPLRDIPVNEVTTQDVLNVLKPLWMRAPETADRTRLRIERVLDAAEARGFRDRTTRNPASWKGNLKHLLSARRKLTRGHHTAMPYERVADFVAALRSRRSNSALALDFLILTAARSGEVLGATWSEILGDVWIVPKERMKARREHRVPLSKAALAVLEKAKALNGDDPLIFPGSGIVPKTNRRKQLSVMAMTVLIRKMTDHYVMVGQRKLVATPHGFRSSFRDWAGSETEYPRELAEEALAHLVGNAVERAYRRADSLKRRRTMMEDWANYLRASSAHTVANEACLEFSDQAGSCGLDPQQT